MSVDKSHNNVELSGLFASEMDRLGKVDLGVNATGVVNSTLHYDRHDDQYIIEETMPAQYVEQCMKEVHAMSTTYRKRQHGDAGQLLGRLPLPIWYAWRREWSKTGKKHGVMWRAFLGQKIYDGDYKKFRIDKIT